MTPTLNKLYKTLYTPPESTSVDESIDECYKNIKEHFSAEDYELIEQLVGNLMYFWDIRVEHAWRSGFRSAMHLTTELNMYDIDETEGILSEI